MAASKESVFVALQARLQTVAGVDPSNVLRKDVEPDNLAPERQPALVLLADDLVPLQERGRPTKWLIHAWIILYVRGLEADDSPDTQLLTIIDAVETSLARQPQEAITDPTNPYHTNLGGACSRCWISGAIKVFRGDVSTQAAAVFPLEILV